MLHLDTSWPMPMKGVCPVLEDENLEVSVMSQWLDVQLYNNEVVDAFAAEEGEEEGEEAV